MAAYVVTRGAHQRPFRHSGATQSAKSRAENGVFCRTCPGFCRRARASRALTRGNEMLARFAAGAAAAAQPAPRVAFLDRSSSM